MSFLPIVDKAYSYKFREGELRSFGRASVVHNGIVEGIAAVRKCYLPERFQEYERREYQRLSKSPFRGSLSSKSERQDYFWKEAGALAVSGSFPSAEQFASRVLGVYPPTLTIFMEETRTEDYRTSFFKGNEKRVKTEELVRILSRLHAVWGNHLEEMYHRIAVERQPLLKPRNKEEEFQRWLRYFKTIIYRTSDGFAAYFKEKTDRDLLLTNDKGLVHKMINRYLRENQVNLDQAVHEFIERDWNISFGDEYDKKSGLFSTKDSINKQGQNIKELYRQGLVTIIHGDFNPQNVFREELKVCDFPEMRVDRRTVDVIGAVYNIYNMPHGLEEEVETFGLIRKYIDHVQEHEKVALDPARFIVQSLEARLKYGAVGLFAIDCKYIPAEIQSLVQGWSRFKEVIESEDLAKTFLKEMFIERYQRLSDYFLGGEGLGLVRDFEKVSELLKQFKLVEEIFEKTGVVKPTPRSAREDLFKRITGNGDSG